MKKDFSHSPDSTDDTPRYLAERSSQALFIPPLFHELRWLTTDGGPV
jgi:hypothetical protein